MRGDGLAILSTVIAWAGLLDGKADAADPLPLNLRVTYRSFLPAICMGEKAYSFAWASNHSGSDVMRGTYPSDFVQDADYLAGSIPSERTRVMFSTRDKLSDHCPYFTSMVNGEISGHPDFEASMDATTGQKCNGMFVPGTPETFLQNQVSKFIRDDLVNKPSGLRKVQFCDTVPGPGVKRCGAYNLKQGDPNFKPELEGQFTTSKQENFEWWFNDNKKYAKRVGDFLTLVFNPTNKQFVFDSAASSTQQPKFNPLGKFLQDSTEAKYPNPLDAPVWPAKGLGKENGKFWFSTEIHTSFEYRGGEVFNFAGDDDVFVFVNGLMIIELRGLHGIRRQEVKIDDIAAAAGLVKGKIYPFDMFHAERHVTGSNFRVETTLTTNCNVLLSGSVSFDSKKALPSAYFVGGVARVQDKAIELVPQGARPGDAAHAYVAEKFNAGAGFIAKFTFTVSPQGLPDGFAVVLHNRDQGLDNLIISTGRNLNYREIANVTAIVFDLCVDAGTCKEQQVSIQRPATPGETIPLGANPRMTRQENIMRSLRLAGESHEVSIEYLDEPDWLEVYIDNSLYLREEGYRAKEALQGRDAFIGFASAVSVKNPAQITIADLVLTSVTIAPEKTTAIRSAEPSRAPADGASPAFVTFQTRDLCSNAVENGGFKTQAAAIFVEQLAAESSGPGDRRRLSGTRTYFNGSLTPLIIQGNITDLGNGQYTADLATTVPATFKAYLCFGAETGCSFTTVEKNSTDPTAAPGMKEVVVSPQGALYSDSVDNAVVMDPLTPTPTLSPTVLPSALPDNTATVTGAAIGGGVGFIALISSLLVLFVLRRKWRRDKNFVDGGREYRADLSVDMYSKSDTYTQVGKSLLDTRAAVLKERAQTTKQGLGTQISSLQQTNEDLAEQVRIAKMAKQQQDVSYSSTFRAKGAQKKEFLPDL